MAAKLAPGAARIQISIRSCGMVYTTVRDSDELRQALRAIRSDDDRERAIGEALRIISRDHLDGFEIAYVNPSEVASLAWLSPKAANDRLMERVSRVLERAEPDGLSVNRIDQAIRGNYDDMRAALGALVRGGYVEWADGPRGAKVHRIVEPYRADDVEEAW